jgi:thiol:disulfide interchange protein
MKRILPFLFASLALAAGPGIRWETRLADAQKRAKAEGRLIFMDVWTEWCGWCIKLQKETFPAPQAQAALARMVPLSLKTQLKNGAPTENAGVEKAYGIQGYPTLIVLDANGKVILRHSGFLDAASFAAWINEASPSRGRALAPPNK